MTMTPEQRDAVFASCWAPNSPPTVTYEELLAAFGASDGEALGEALVLEAVDARDPVDLECALIVCFHFGFADELRDVLIGLCFADWHRSHEDVVSALDRRRDPSCTDAFVHMVEWTPSHAEWDDNRALAVKALWGIGNLPGPEADDALRQIASSSDGVVHANAVQQLERRGMELGF